MWFKSSQAATWGRKGTKSPNRASSPPAPLKSKTKTQRRQSSYNVCPVGTTCNFDLSNQRLAFMMQCQLKRSIYGYIFYSTSSKEPSMSSIMRPIPMMDSFPRSCLIHSNRKWGWRRPLYKYESYCMIDQLCYNTFVRKVGSFIRATLDDMFCWKPWHMAYYMAYYVQQRKAKLNSQCTGKQKQTVLDWQNLCRIGSLQAWFSGALRVTCWTKTIGKSSSAAKLSTTQTFWWIHQITTYNNNLPSEETVFFSEFCWSSTSMIIRTNFHALRPLEHQLHGSCFYNRNGGLGFSFENFKHFGCWQGGKHFHRMLSTARPHQLCSNSSATYKDVFGK